MQLHKYFYALQHLTDDSGSYSPNKVITMTFNPTSQLWSQNFDCFYWSGVTVKLLIMPGVGISTMKYFWIQKFFWWSGVRAKLGVESESGIEFIVNFLLLPDSVPHVAATPDGAAASDSTPAPNSATTSDSAQPKFFLITPTLNTEIWHSGSNSRFYYEFDFVS